MRISPRPLLRGLTRSNDGLPRSARHTSAVALIAPPGNSNRRFANTSRSTTLIRDLLTGPNRPTTSSPASSDFVYEFLTQDTSFRQLKTLQTVARVGSVSGAAVELHLTQPA